MACGKGSESVSMYSFFDGPDENIENILTHLPMKSLHRCARVCKRWKSVVRRIKKSRKQYGWVFYNEETGTANAEEAVGDHVQWLSFEPHFALLFCSTLLYESRLAVQSQSSGHTSRHPRATKKEKILVTDYLSRILPPSCQLAGLTTDGIVGTLCGEQHVLEEVENAKALSCLLLPKMEGVDIYTFNTGLYLQEQLGPFSVSAETPRPNPEAVASITGIPQDKKPRLVLLFYTEHFVYSEADLSYAILKNFSNVVLAGGYVDNLVPEEQESEEEPFSLGIAFCGENIQVASVVIQSSIRSKQEVERNLVKLKETHIREEQSVGLMFACIGRGRHHYQEPNVEADAFRRLFPRTPLFGIFGNGEIGHDYLPDYSKPEGDQHMTLLGQYPDEEGSGYVYDLPEIHHSYTTIFVLLSLGQNNKH